jgi:uncharacterized metal-binding protein
MRVACHTDEEIAAEIGIAVSSVTVYLSILRVQRNLKYPSRSRWTRKKMEELSERASRMTYHEAGKPFGVKEAQVHRILKKYHEMLVDEDRLKSSKERFD